ncbi:unnamed protein product [Lactuca saligna]|uniref:Uncharacterized protein n=1 Tax=Lactuca saligna TaxID=75948 RepID=A0AA35YZ39_LACSI|nr:unnamed protein product [Lactuca saligna]
MHFFHQNPNRDIHWTGDYEEYLRIDSRNKKILVLANNISSTTSHLQSNVVFTVIHRPATTTRHPPPPPTGASILARPIPNLEYNIYMGEFAQLGQHYTSLQQEVGEIYMGVAKHTSEF